MHLYLTAIWGTQVSNLIIQFSLLSQYEAAGRDYIPPTLFWLELAGMGMHLFLVQYGWCQLQWETIVINIVGKGCKWISAALQLAELSRTELLNAGCLLWKHIAHLMRCWCAVRNVTTYFLSFLCLLSFSLGPFASSSAFHEPSNSGWRYNVCER